MTSELVLTDPSWDLRGGDVPEQGQRDALTSELAAELSESHNLHGQVFTVVAKSEANDEAALDLAVGLLLGAVPGQVVPFMPAGVACSLYRSAVRSG
jgi:hypothetical protein